MYGPIIAEIATKSLYDTFIFPNLFQINWFISSIFPNQYIWCQYDTLTEKDLSSKSAHVMFLSSSHKTSPLVQATKHYREFKPQKLEIFVDFYMPLNFFKAAKMICNDF